MLKLQFVSLLFMLVFTMQSCAQEKETYWKIESIYREDKEPFRGMTELAMNEIYDYNFHFVKRSDSLYFDLPDKFVVGLTGFNNLRQLQIADRDYYEMYDYSESNNSFIIKFKDNATGSKSKNTIIAFKKITKEEYNKDIDDAIIYQKDIAKKINDLKSELEKTPPIVLDPVKILATKDEYIYSNNYDDEIILRIPEEIELHDSGDLKNEKFGNIKIGTLRDHSKIYDLEHALHDYGLKQLTLWVSTDSAIFNMEDYISENTDIVVMKNEPNNIMGYKITYDFDKEEAVIGSFFTLKYYKVGSTHLFIHSDVYASQIKNALNKEEMNKILNFNYLISENITLKPAEKEMGKK